MQMQKQMGILIRNLNSNSNWIINNYTRRYGYYILTISGEYRI